MANGNEFRRHLYTWVAQSVERPALDFSSGHDPTVRGFEPHIGLHTESVESAWDSVSASSPLAHSLSLSLSE